MSSEPTSQPSGQPDPRGARRRDAGGEPAVGAAELGRRHGYDPDDPGTWPGSQPGTAAHEAAAQEAAAPAEPVKLTDPTVMRAIAHPVRMDLLELLAVMDTLTATQASELLGESPANCAFHLRTLAKYGFVKEAGGGRGRERPWTAVNRVISISSVQEDPQAAVAAEALSRMVFERWVERARQVFVTSASLPGWEHAQGYSRSAAFLTPDETVELRQEMRRMLDRYDARRADPSLRPAGALPVEWAIFSAPVAELASMETRGPEPGSEPDTDAEAGPDPSAD